MSRDRQPSGLSRIWSTTALCSSICYYKIFAPRMNKLAWPTAVAQVSRPSRSPSSSDKPWRTVLASWMEADFDGIDRIAFKFLYEYFDPRHALGDRAALGPRRFRGIPCPLHAESDNTCRGIGNEAACVVSGPRKHRGHRRVQDIRPSDEQISTTNGCRTRFSTVQDRVELGQAMMYPPCFVDGG